MTDEQRTRVFLVGAGIAMGAIGGYYIGKVVGMHNGAKIATNSIMSGFGVLAEAAKVQGEFPLIIEHVPTNTKMFCTVLPEATEAFKDLVAVKI